MTSAEVIKEVREYATFKNGKGRKYSDGYHRDVAPILREAIATMKSSMASDELALLAEFVKAGQSVVRKERKLLQSEKVALRKFNRLVK